MDRVGSAIRLMLFLPPMWIAMVVTPHHVLRTLALLIIKKELTMKFSLVLDMPFGWIVFFFGFSIALPVLFLLVIWIEATVLKRFKYGSFGRSFRASLAMNVVSAILGFVVALSLRSVFLSKSGMPSYSSGEAEIAQWLFLASNSLFLDSRLPGALLFLLISWMISVVSEGKVLMAMKGDVEPLRIWKMTLVANAASYVLLFGAYIAIICYL